MPKNLVIVESPAKARTIERYLGSGFRVLASYGHIRQLPSKQGSIDVENDFSPKYEVIEDNKKHVAALKKELKSADALLLATDRDREGEAIAWHLTEVLGADPTTTKRITFNEITKEAIQEALKQQHTIDHNLVSAQEARQTLDYLYGFTLSPFLWKKVRYGLSAGRVQSVALRLIVEREREINAFEPQEYWTLDARLQADSSKEGVTFAAQLVEDAGKKLAQFDLTRDRATELATELPDYPVVVDSIEKKQRKRNPAPPFTTSTLQQEASRKLGFAARRTMRTAQQLYEGIQITGEGSIGLITYMRTDSVHLADSALREARTVIERQFGKEFLPEQPRRYKTKSKGAQEAHEAVRPTSFARRPDDVAAHLTPDQLKLYRLIWQRAIASQMAEALLDQTTVHFRAGRDGTSRLKSTGSVIAAAGFMKVYLEGRDDAVAEDDERLLPKLTEGSTVTLKEITPEQHFTSPPPRYTEASLVKTLEEYGIGRPSTYASIISTIQDRKYARLEERRFFPEDVGIVVSDLLTKHFSKYVDYEFTAHLETELDEIADGENTRLAVLREFWDPFTKLISEKDKSVTKEEVTHEATDKKCPECGEGNLVIKLGRYGRFYGCSRYPECRYMAPLEDDAKEREEAEATVTDEKCPQCEAPMTVKRGRFGMFLACTRYPECKGTKPLVKSTGVTCPKCKKGELGEKRTKRGKIFYGCSTYPSCDFASWQEPVKEPCPKCKGLVTKRGKAKIACTECDWEAENAPTEA